VFQFPGRWFHQEARNQEEEEFPQAACFVITDQFKREFKSSRVQERDRIKREKKKTSLESEKRVDGSEIGMSMLLSGTPLCASFLMSLKAISLNTWIPFFRFDRSTK